MDQKRHGRDKWAQFDDSSCVQPASQEPIPLTEDSFTNPALTTGVVSRALDDRTTSFAFARVPTDKHASANPNNSLFQALPDACQKQVTIPGPTGMEQKVAPSTRLGSGPSEKLPGIVPSRPSAVAAAPRTDLWHISSEQRAYYLSQFLRLQSDPRTKLSGSQAKMFFELSKLPTTELSDIWELSDVDRDGQLTLSEFVVAMHLVVLRRNGVPVPRILPDVLMEVITSQSLSTLAPAAGAITAPPCLLDPSEAVPPVVDRSDLSLPTGTVLFATNAHRPWHGSPTATTTCSSVAQTPVSGRQRRWSISSQSDISSLAEGIIHFEAKPNVDGHLQHPIPVRARTLPMEFSGPDITSAVQNYPFDPTTSRLFTTAPDDTLVPSSPMSGEHPIPVTVASPISNQMPKSTPPPLPPPPPPPRAHVAGRLQTAGGDELQSQPLVVNYHGPESTADTPELGVTSFATKEIKTDRMDGDNVVNLNRLAELIRTNGSDAVIAQLQRECDEVMQTNDQLASELMQLQQHRIALKILLERLMPLEAASYPS